MIVGDGDGALIRPRRLRPGDRVAVVAPSGPVDPERVERGMAWLTELGFEVVGGKHLLESVGQGLPFLAGNDADRAGDLLDAWLDPTVAAVICARGGAGADRVVELLNWDAMRAAPPKLFVGLSDATVLHRAFAARLGIATLWGPMVAAEVVAGRRPDPVTRASLADALLAPERTLSLPGAGEALVEGTARGVVTGGTLALLVAGLGTSDAGTGRGRIVILEDIGELPYRVDRMLTQLRRSGWLDGVAGLALGSWVGCGDPAELHQVFRDRLGDLGVPVVTGLPFGHGDVQACVHLGVPAVLDAAAGSLRYEVPCVS